MQVFLNDKWHGYALLLRDKSLSVHDVFCKTAGDYKVYLRRHEDSDKLEHDEFMKKEHANNFARQLKFRFSEKRGGA